MDKLQELKEQLNWSKENIPYAHALDKIEVEQVEWLISEVERLRENQEKLKPFIQLFNEHFGTNLTIGSDEVK